jgi:glycosyltransferase involved in cell wall biosynthesis
MKSDTNISLVISTYNNPVFLELVLMSVLKQELLPYEVIVADDGSGQETKKLVEEYQKNFSVPLLHVWHNDDGYRLSAIKNKAAAKASGGYIIFIDGDLLLHPLFIYDFAKNMKEGHIHVGSRVFLSEAYTKQLVKHKNATVRLRPSEVEKNFIAGLRTPWLHHFIKGSTTHVNARGGLLGVFKNDYVKVNGFNEAFTGWGREDSELFVRLLNSGIKRKNIKFAAITYHLWHPLVSRKSLDNNDAMLASAIKEKTVWCNKGISQYL